MDHLDALDRAIEQVVAPGAPLVDATGEYPRAGLDALGRAGLLGLISSTDVGGMGLGIAVAAEVIERLATACGSTAMVVMMHYSAVALIEAHGPEDVRKAIASGTHVSTLAFSETGSRSQFWAPIGTATLDGDAVVLDASKSWVTSAGRADSYVWSSRPVAAEGPMTLWLVPADADGLRVTSPFDGLGLRGNASSPVLAEHVRVHADAQLGEDGAGLDLALSVALPWFLVLNAAANVGFMRASLKETRRHLGATRLEHLDQTLGEQVLPRVEFARMQLQTDQAAAFVTDTLAAIGSDREDAQLRVLEVKAAVGEAAIEVTDLAMQVCGGAAFRKELGIERRFRDARAARVMAPTTDALLDIVGRLLLDLPLLGDVS